MFIFDSRFLQSAQVWSFRLAVQRIWTQQLLWDLIESRFLLVWQICGWFHLKVVDPAMVAQVWSRRIPDGISSEVMLSKGRKGWSIAMLCAVWYASDSFAESWEGMTWAPDMNSSWDSASCRQKGVSSKVPPLAERWELGLPDVPVCFHRDVMGYSRSLWSTSFIRCFDFLVLRWKHLAELWAGRPGQSFGDFLGATFKRYYVRETRAGVCLKSFGCRRTTKSEKVSWLVPEGLGIKYGQYYGKK